MKAVRYGEYEQAGFSMPVARTFGLAQAPDAHRLSEDGHVRGRIVLTVHPDAHG